MQGSIGGSAAQPQCDVSMRLLDGKIGSTALELAEATGAVDAERRCVFNAKFGPAEAPGHLNISGSVPLAASDRCAHPAPQKQTTTRVGKF